MESSFDGALRPAGTLARQLRDEPWYHRTSVEQILHGNGVAVVNIKVWGEGVRPDSLPRDWAGYPVTYQRVSADEPCPFGSVKGV